MNKKAIRSIMQDGLTSENYDHHDRESEMSLGWKRSWDGPHRPTLVYDLDRDPPYQIALPYEAGVEHVYFVYAPEVGRVKIGWSTDAGARLSSMQSGSPCELLLVKLIPGGRDLERKLHVRYRQFHIEGEWFSEEVLAEWAKDPFV